MTYADEPTIRWAILRRLDKEPGVQVCDIPIRDGGKDGIRVGVLAQLDGPDGLIVRSRFDLPEVFELIHIHNEVDEIAEQYKAARADFWKHGRMPVSERAVAGNGIRGRWAQHGG